MASTCSWPTIPAAAAGDLLWDSGGPTLLDDTDVMVAVTSWGFGFNRQTCGGVGYRTDQQAVIDWILEHAGDEADEITIMTI